MRGSKSSQISQETYFRGEDTWLAILRLEYTQNTSRVFILRTLAVSWAVRRMNHWSGGTWCVAVLTLVLTLKHGLMGSVRIAFSRTRATPPSSARSFIF